MFKREPVENTGHIVLLVEDDPLIALAITETFAATGIKVCSAGSVSAALDFVGLRSPQLMLLDYHLPDGTAFDFLDQLVEYGRPLSPFIVLTGSGDEQVAVAMMKRGARDYLVKDKRLLDALPLVVQKVLRDLALEEELRQTREQLQHNEELLRCAFDQAAVGMVFVALDGRLLRYNQRYAEIVGYPFADLGKLTFQEITHSDDIDRQLELMKKLLSGTFETISFEKRYSRSDGSSTWADLAISLVRSPTGEPSHLFAVVKDMTKRFEYETKLDEARKIAESASLAKTEFLANMSHEIRTPLNGILGMLQLLETTALDEEQRGYAEIAARSSWGLLQLLNDLLDLSRIEVGQLAIRNEALDIRKLANDCCDLFHPKVLDKGLDLSCTIASEVPIVLTGDSTRIRQILFNLIGNAVKFTAQGGVRLSIELLDALQPGRLGLCFKVSDTGIGMSPQMLERAFEPFTQEEGTYQRNYQGAGLGLSIVKRLAELMDGTVSIATPACGGTVVTVTIEVGRAGPVTPLESEEAQYLFPNLEAKAQLQILLAEDNAINRMMLKKMLEKFGHVVEAVENGRQAIDALRQSRFDLIVMDIQMTEMDGLEATRLIRSDQSGRFDPRIPIIAVTAYALPGAQQSFLTAGIDGCLTKPIALGALHAILENQRPSQC